MDTLLRGYGMQPRWTFTGMIIPFFGTFGGEGNRFPIPLGGDAPDMHWCLCDGTTTNGLPVPDLRGRMILGASDSVPVGSTGGSETHSHSISGTVGSTTLTVEQIPNHVHGSREFVAPGTVYGAMSSVANHFTNAEGTYGTGGSQPHTHALSVASGSANSLPPYYTLAYIMRCA